MLTKRKKLNEVKKTQRHDSDTGSPEVQVAILTRRIEELSVHLDKKAATRVLVFAIFIKDRKSVV